jgi:hypothetical protein
MSSQNLLLAVSLIRDLIAPSFQTIRDVLAEGHPSGQISSVGLADRFCNNTGSHCVAENLQAG